jgi:hypothetical protein
MTERKKISLNFKPAAEAVVTEHLPDGGYICRLDGKFHAVGKPAIKNAQGGEQWYEYGLRHRLGGPAMSTPDGHEEYCERGVTHRIDGYARKFPNGTKHWVQNNQLHRDDGPAIEDATGANTAYFLHGQTPTPAQMTDILARQHAREKREREEIAVQPISKIRKRSGGAAPA